MLVTYTFVIENGRLKVIGEIDKNLGWFLDEQWCTEQYDDKIILNQTENRIEYQTGDIPEFEDDRLYCYPMVRNDYACFTGSIGLYFPMVEDDYVPFDIRFSSNVPLYVSGIGLIRDSDVHSIDLRILKNMLFVFTDNTIERGDLILTYMKGTYFFIPPKEMIDNVSKFISRCVEFFDIDTNQKFMINYNGFVVKPGGEIGYGGNGNYAGFNFLITQDTERISEKKKSKITIMLLHELYHHYNKSGDYQSNWFGEGFTEYFCRYLSQNESKFKSECNKYLIQYYLNPYRNAKIDIMTRHNFWNNKFIEKLPYAKGFVYSLFLHRKYGAKFIKRYKKIIIDTYRDPKTKPDNVLLKKYLKDDKFDEYIIDGKTIEIETDDRVSVKSVKIGFDIDSAINHKKIVDLDNRSEAYQKGVRVGEIEQLYINMSEGTIKIKQNGKDIEFDILRGKSLSIPQL